MPTQCRLVPSAAFYADDHTPQAGDMWFRCAPDVWRARVEQWRAEGAKRDDPMVARLSDQYLAGTIDRRPPLMVVLPNGDYFGVDSSISGETRGWQVAGEPPRITVSPSINCVGAWHGWLQDGVLSDDVEGRAGGR